MYRQLVCRDKLKLLSLEQHIRDHEFSSRQHQPGHCAVCRNILEHGDTDTQAAETLSLSSSSSSCVPRFVTQSHKDNTLVTGDPVSRSSSSSRAESFTSEHTWLRQLRRRVRRSEAKEGARVAATRKHLRTRARRQTACEHVLRKVGFSSYHRNKMCTLQEEARVLRGVLHVRRVR